MIGLRVFFSRIVRRFIMAKFITGPIKTCFAILARKKKLNYFLGTHLLFYTVNVPQMVRHSTERIGGGITKPPPKFTINPRLSAENENNNFARYLHMAARRAGGGGRGQKKSDGRRPVKGRQFESLMRRPSAGL